MKEQDNLISALMHRYELDESTSRAVLEFAKSLAAPEREANDLAVARELNRLATEIFNLVLKQGANGIQPDISDINRSYILIVDELKRIYLRNPKLQEHKNWAVWSGIESIEGNEDVMWNYSFNNGEDTGQRHRGQLNKLCILGKVDQPELDANLKKLTEQAEADIKKYQEELGEEPESSEKTEKPGQRDWHISRYYITHSRDGALWVNGVCRLSKPQAGSVPTRFLEEVFKRPNELFKPELGTSRRAPSSILNDIGVKGDLRKIFFPQTSAKNGVLFRPTVTLGELTQENIDTTKVDDLLRENGAEIRDDTEIDIDSIPF